ncbi:hypothetical protein DES38_101195 [Streptohalobacillus salinus]|uniref:DUF2929 family protein n=1 Tax=Streptohalobacillus salinus TaxID=621096 RepID=A0A2V3WVI6_9BACI|nr:DUF2929 family protein [Streptohalobacillus salinus]PXW93112.1 hypothetical protein DES38_101195 [Streptohalobacillus salinus]
MRIIILMIWSFFISLLLGYVLTSMAGEGFSWFPVIAMTVIFTLVGAFVGETLIED